MDKNVVTWGCNAIYRDGPNCVHNLVAMDYAMQQEIYDSVDDNTIINAGCSFGKTFTALSLVEKLGQKTLIIVHTLKLMEQWVIEIDKVLGSLYASYEIVNGLENFSMTKNKKRLLFNGFNQLRKNDFLWKHMK